MPKKVTIGKKEVFIDRFDNECLKKRKLEKPKMESVIFDGGIGEFVDLLYRDELLIARTTKGWFFSKTKGRTWLSEDDAENHDEINLDKSSAEYTFIRGFIREYINKELDVKKHNTFTVKEKVNAKNHPCIELIELDNDKDLEQFFIDCLHISDTEGENPFLIFPKNKRSFVQKTLFDFHFKDEKFPLQRSLVNIDYTFFFTPDFGVENMFNFGFNMIRAKQKHDTKLFIISDLTLFFKKDTNLDFIESTLRNLCHNAELLGMRIIIPYSKRTQKLNKEAIDFIRKFNHNFLDYFVQVQSDEDEILIKEKIVRT